MAIREIEWREDYLRKSVVPRGLPFHNGDRLSQPVFHRLYKQVPLGLKVELVGGTVCVASPTHFQHSQPHLRLAGWIDRYIEVTPGIDGFDNTSNILGPDSEPQPDLCLIILPKSGGRTKLRKGLIVGGPELVVEVAHTSAAIDLGTKKADYLAAGVQEYVVALAREREVRWFVNRAGRFEPDELTDGLYRSHAFPGLWLNPAGVFTPTNRRLVAALKRGLASPEHARFVEELRSRRRGRP